LFSVPNAAYFKPRFAIWEFTIWLTMLVFAGLLIWWDCAIGNEHAFSWRGITGMILGLFGFLVAGSWLNELMANDT